jgi:drug/metabolite transporter (DMT)-like permease
MIRRSESGRGILLAIFTAVMWGLLAIALKLVLIHISPITVIFFRFSLAFIMLLVFYLLKRPSGLKIILRPHPLLILAACALGLNYLGFIKGLNFTTPGTAQIFIQTGSVLLAFSGFVFFKEKASKMQLFGLLVVLTGMVIFYHEQLSVGGQGISLLQKGVLWIIFGGIMWAVYAVSQKVLIKSFNPMELNLVLFGLPALFYCPFADYNTIIHASVIDWVLLLFVGLNTLLAYGSLSYAFKYLEANKISVIITLNPIITFIIMGIFSLLQVKWIGQETFSYPSLIGATLVIIGTVLVVIRRKD